VTATYEPLGVANLGVRAFKTGNYMFRKQPKLLRELAAMRNVTYTRDWPRPARQRSTARLGNPGPAQRFGNPAGARITTPAEAAKAALDAFGGDRVAAVDFVAGEASAGGAEPTAFWSEVVQRLLQNLQNGETAFLSPEEMERLSVELGKDGPWGMYRVRHGWPEGDFNVAGQRLTEEDVARAYEWFAWPSRAKQPVQEAHRVFYLGTHRSSWLDQVECSVDVPDEMVASWVESAGIPLFISRRQLEKRRKLPRARARWALDSGGFTELSKFGRWELTAREYVALVRRFRDEIGMLDWAAPMDWMCEIEQLHRTWLSVPQHVERTVNNFLELRSLAPDLPIIPVLQGLRMQDYALCLRLYEKAGVDLRKEKAVGLGSVCRRQASNEVVEFAEAMSKYGLRLHGFGFKIEGLKKAQNFFVSADSMAWSYGARRAEGGFCPEGKNSCSNCLHAALEWRENLLNKIARTRFWEAVSDGITDSAVLKALPLNTEWAYPWR
jgi:hypothetical protein